jgi:hypothetical protein
MWVDGENPLKDETKFVVPDAPRTLSEKPFNEHGIRSGAGKASGISDPRYTVPVKGMTPATLEFALRQSIESVKQNFPDRTGILIFTFDFGPAGEGGLGYISNADRKDVIAAMRDWIKRQESEK